MGLAGSPHSAEAVGKLRMSATKQSRSPRKCSLRPRTQPISSCGVILQDETMRQQNSHGIPLADR